tara:strand:- start:519 stop:791 length:273 start_codon:yes stop_codon:yes gene_type:complete
MARNFLFNEVFNILKDLKKSSKNEEEALKQTLLKNLFFNYRLLAMTLYAVWNASVGDWTSNNILGMIEIGDEGVDLLIKTFESGFKSLKR